MLKKKAFNKIFITTIIFFITFSMYTIKEKTYQKQESISSKETKEILYTLNDNNYISKTEIYVSKSLTLEDKIKEKLEIMVEENNKNALLPSYFNPILPVNTKIENVVVEESLVKVYFSKELENINEKQSEKMIEAIIYTITNENILGIEIYVEDEMLKYVPHTKKELPTILTKDFGINKTYDISSTNNIVKIVMTYYREDNNNYYEIPVTKYVNSNKDKLELIIDQLETIKNKDLLTLVEGITILDYKITNKNLKINLNKELNKEEETIFISTIFNNYDLEKIELFVKNIKKTEKYKKDIENY